MPENKHRKIARMRRRINWIRKGRNDYPRELLKSYRIARIGWPSFMFWFKPIKVTPTGFVQYTPTSRQILDALADMWDPSQNTVPNYEVKNEK